MSLKEFRLKNNHTWKIKPGHSICVLERGLVRFDYPSHWIVEPAEGAVMLHDREPSIESCDLGVSLFQVPGEAIHALSLDQMLVNSLDSEREAYEQSDVRHTRRDDLEIAWLEQHYVDRGQKRDARFRVALVRGPVLCLLSMNYWADRASELEPVWEDVLGTLVLGMQVSDPAHGPVVQ